jgi:ABC-type branched-subunit amino acid transport system substrate-binding protein
MLRFVRLDPRLFPRWLGERRRRSVFVLVLGPLLVLALVVLMTGAVVTSPRSDELVAEGSDSGLLEGMKGSRPISVQDEDFRAALKDVWFDLDPLGNPLDRFEYAAEAYDATIVAALAAEAAGTDGGELADHIVEVTTDGESCRTFRQCKILLSTGRAIAFEGMSGRLVMNAQGETVISNFSVVEFGADNRIDPERTRYVELVGSSDASPPVTSLRERIGDGSLTIGSLLPLSGQLAVYAPAQQAAIRLAIKEINSSGGVLGSEVTYVEGDSGDTSSDKMSTELERLIDEGVDVIVGPSSTAVTVRLIDRILEAGLVQISPANTNGILVGFEDDGRYFRIAPSDDQQAYLLADLITEDALRRVGVFAVDDLYGNSMMTRLVNELERRQVEVVLVDLYNPQRGDFTENVEAMKQVNPEGIVVISFEEGAQLLRAMVRAQIGPRNVAVYGVDANMGDALGETFDVSE